MGEITFLLAEELSHDVFRFHCVPIRQIPTVIVVNNIVVDESQYKIKFFSTKIKLCLKIKKKFNSFLTLTKLDACS